MSGKILDAPIRPNKAALANRAVSKHKITSFVDLGACWRVNAGYALNLLAQYPIKRAVAVDTNITDLSRERGAAYPQLTFVEGMIGDRDVLQTVGAVDAAIMFDILLHQVAPDWNELLAQWGAQTRVLIIYNQMWKQNGSSVRFIERGKEWYLSNVYYADPERVDKWFATHDAFHERQKKPVRDIHNFWQWGITTEDLISAVTALGFRLDFYKNYDRFHRTTHPWIQDEGFIFVRA